MAWTRALEKTERAEVRTLTCVVPPLACVQLPCTSISHRKHGRYHHISHSAVGDAQVMLSIHLEAHSTTGDTTMRQTESAKHHERGLQLIVRAWLSLGLPCGMPRTTPDRTAAGPYSSAAQIREGQSCVCGWARYVSTRVQLVCEQTPNKINDRVFCAPGHCWCCRPRGCR